jgi:hypothetical protein
VREPCLVAQQAVHARLHEAFLQRQTTDLLLPVCRMISAVPVRRERDDPDAPNVLLRAVPVGYDRCRSLGSLHIHRLIVPHYEAVVTERIENMHNIILSKPERVLVASAREIDALAVTLSSMVTHFLHCGNPGVGEVQRWSDST